QGGFISLEAAVDLLKQYVETMRDYVTDDPELPGERERIIKSWIMRRRLEDGEGLEQQAEEIERELENE
ncbi:phage portal protein, partial [Carboxydocella sp. ULO1]